ncbi:BCCT family transporter [uncultured Endozoicomonas sp.]|uniref:BCCT family transporter n=1 Tax=uncultured Endozoicomonas sp. TaxID=432652 RepID=UPI002611F7E2|nr:BCCT family transporter [uncultured Endozoicomonas sp.]
MATWTEPFGGYGPFEDTHFPQDWTIFYWAWWLVFAPSMGLFVARISRGRIIKQMVAGAIFCGSFGCALYFIVMGNFGLSLQLSGQLDVVGILNESGHTKAIFSVLEQLHFSYVFICLFTLLCIIFTATTFDSISFILASVVQTNVTDDPMRWNRLFWVFTLSLMPSVLMFVGGLTTLQTAAIVGGIPLLIIAIMLMIAAVKATHLDIATQVGYEDSTIHIEDLPDVDPWSLEGAALARFEALRDQATKAAIKERKALNNLVLCKKEVRMEAMARRMSGADLGDEPQYLLNREAMLTQKVVIAKEQKFTPSELAQRARIEFDELMRHKESLT